MSDSTMTFQVDEDLKADFSTPAKAPDHTGTQLPRDFMRDFVKQQQETALHDVWFRSQVQAGLDFSQCRTLGTSRRSRSGIFRTAGSDAQKNL